LLSTTNLFNFDESSVIWTLLFPNGVPIPSYGNADATARAAGQKLVSRQTPTMPPYKGMTNMISGPLEVAWDSMADRFQIDRNGFVYGAVKRTLAKTTADIETETNLYVSRIQDVLYKDITGAVTEEFGKLTVGLPLPPGLLVPKPASIVARDLNDDDLEETYLDKKSEHMSEFQKQAFIQEVQGEQIKRILIRDLANIPVPKPGSTIASLLEGTNLSALAGGVFQTGVQMVTGYTDSLVADLNKPASANLAAMVIKDSGPYISWAVRDFVNSIANDNIKVIKKGFNVQDYYAFYQSRFCYGQSINSTRKVRGCKTTAYMQNADMAPRVNNTVKLYQSNRQVPKSMPLGKNLEDTIRGTRSFTSSIWTVDVTSAVLAGLAFLSALVGMFMPHRFERLMDIIGIGFTVGSGLLLLLSTSTNFLLVQAIHLILPGSLKTLNIENTEGWKFVTLLFVALVMEGIAIAFWIWLGIRNVRARAIISVTPSAQVSHTTHTTHYSPTSSDNRPSEVVEKA
jgi:hypothetical protein